MNGLIIGYGSIGKRYRNILGILGYRVCVISKHMSGDNFYNNIDGYINMSVDPDLVIICSSTINHERDADAVLKAFPNCNLLIEKPLGFIPMNDFLNRKKSYVGFNLRFHPIVLELRDIFMKEKVLHSSLEIRRYLPTMRSTSIDYSESYSCYKDQGGGVVNDFSHELDLVMFWFGDVVDFKCKGGKIGKLKGDSEDSFVIISEHERCRLVCIQMSYLDRKSCRIMRFVTTENTYEVDLDNGYLNKKHYGENALAESYIHQIRDISNKKNILCNMNEASKVERWIKRIKVEL